MTGGPECVGTMTGALLCEGATGQLFRKSEDVEHLGGVLSVLHSRFLIIYPSSSRVSLKISRKSILEILEIHQIYSETLQKLLS